MKEQIFRIARDAPMADADLVKLIRKNDQITARRYKKLWDAYCNSYKIFNLPKKPGYKPDNRLAVNFAEYIVNTFEGFFLGLPAKVSHDDPAVAEYLNTIDDANDSDDRNAELSTTVAIFGRAYMIVFVDEDGEIGTAHLDPMESFAVYDDAIKPHMLYFVRTYYDGKKTRRGSVSDAESVRYFHLSGGSVVWDGEAEPHGFGAVPAVEFVQNATRRGIFESVLPLIDAYNKALSEKANDVDYFADAYLKILGAKVDEETIKFMRTNRTINLSGREAKSVIVDFLQKPSADGTQENLLDRMERLIFTIAMVCNISDDDFATSSGIALRYKMLPMINLAAAKWRKFAAGLNKYYRLVCSNPVTPLKEDDWRAIKYTHLLNYPANVAEEASIAGTLSGITSRQTQLSVLSIVDNVDKEIEQIEKEQEEAADYLTAMPTARAPKQEQEEREGVTDET